MSCIKCGGDIVGDGYSTPMRCEYAEDKENTPDADITYCDFEEQYEAEPDFTPGNIPF